MLYTQQGKFQLLLTDLIGRSINLIIEKIIEPRKVFLLNISHRITADLKSEIKFSLDSINLLEIRINEPLFMFNQVKTYQSFFNRSEQIEFQDFEFGLAELIMCGQILNDVEKIKLLNYFNQKMHSKLVWFNKKSYGHSSPGTENMKMEGNVELRDFSNK